MKLFYLLFLCVFSIFYTLSCYIPDQLLGSTPVTNNNNNNNDDDDNDSTNDRNFCWNRDSCQDTCDSLFRMQTARHECSELTYQEVNTLAEVSDLLATKVNNSGQMEVGDFKLKDLEDIESEDLNLYLQIGFNSFLDAIENIVISGEVDTTKPFMKWVAENEDIAKVVASHDNQYELGQELFTKLTRTIGNSSFTEVSNTLLLRISGGEIHQNFSDPDPNNHIDEGSDRYVLFNGSNEEASIDGSHIFNIDTDDFNINRIGRFLWGFIGRNVDDSEFFLDHADYEENEEALKWGHNTLVAFCESISNGHVKQCLQIVYCAHRTVDNRNGEVVLRHAAETAWRNLTVTSDGIFDLMDDHRDIFGKIDARRCSSEEIQEERRFKNLFNP